MTPIQTAAKLLSFINASVSPYHVVGEAVQQLEAAGFKPLSIDDDWNLVHGEAYYIIPFRSCLFAFIADCNAHYMHIAAAHTDFPCLHIKPQAELLTKGYMRINTDVYGAPILSTWLDRPLSIAGRVHLRSNDVFKPKQVMINFNHPLLTIPNLAIHYNHDMNKGIELTRQNDMLPLLGMMNNQLNEKSYFIDLLADEMKVSREDILDFDLYVYTYEQGTILGLNDEFISSPRLDNLTSCHALINAAVNSAGNTIPGQLNIIALYDNEEVGSRTKQGADSALLPYILEKLFNALGKSRSDLNNAMFRSFLISADVAHALHPAKSDKYDPVNYSLINEGVTLKLSANQRYSYDSEAVASLQQLCDKNNIRYKKFVNHSDMPGGTTLGPLISSWLPMKTVDVGVPILAMHSAREIMGLNDQNELVTLLTAFFTKSN